MNLKDIKNKLFKNVNKNNLYSYLCIAGNKLKVDFDIYLLTEEQNNFNFEPVFIVKYKNKTCVIKLETTFYELTNFYSNKYNLPGAVVLRINDILTKYSNLFLNYYNEEVGRIFVLSNLT